MRKRKIGMIAGVLLSGLLLSGCIGSDAESKAEAAESSHTIIEVQKDGNIIETITEDFSADYYEEEDLRNMILSEVAEFNRDAEGDISVDKLEAKSGTITVRMKYPSADAYTQYNSTPFDNRSLFCGTVAQAYDAGYSLDVALKKVGDEEETIGKEEILGMGERHMLISEVPFRVNTFDKILFVSDNVTLLGKSQADMMADENGESLGKYYIIFK